MHYKFSTLFFCLMQTTAIASTPIIADPNLTGAPLPDLLPNSQKQQSMIPAQQIEPDAVAPNMAPPSRMFGAQLFTGTLGNTIGPGFNPSYRLTIGDRVQLRMWGAFNYEGQLTIDPQGNVFIPNVGPVKLSGVQNGELNSVVIRSVKKVYQSNVSIYAALDVAQPVKVYVTGFVNRPGLYGGVASDSVLSYLDKAGGVDPDRGSYVSIEVKRNGQTRTSINLYDFILNGSLGLMQFTDGDVIVVGPRQHTFSVDGEVFNSYDFEFDRSAIPVTEALQWARPKPGATNISIIREQGSVKRSEYYPLSAANQLTLQDGDRMIVTSDRYAGTIQVRIDGAHSGQHALVLPYGATMRQVLAQLKTNSMSQMNAIQLFRKSVATRQREMLDLSLRKLEEQALTATSATNEEATLRTQEAALVSKFVQKAKNIPLKGQVILNESNLDDVLLEDGDIISIPERTSLVLIHGEVLMPNAISWQKGMAPEDYIEKAGGFTQGADKAKIIVMRQNGEAINADDIKQIEPGDEIMVLPKVDTKNIEITKGISTILYQVAVAAKVILNI